MPTLREQLVNIMRVKGLILTLRRAVYLAFAAFLAISQTACIESENPIINPRDLVQVDGLEDGVYSYGDVGKDGDRVEISTLPNSQYHVKNVSWSSWNKGVDQAEKDMKEGIVVFLALKNISESLLIYSTNEETVYLLVSQRVDGLYVGAPEIKSKDDRMSPEQFGKIMEDMDKKKATKAEKDKMSGDYLLANKHAQESAAKHGIEIKGDIISQELSGSITSSKLKALFSDPEFRAELKPIEWTKLTRVSDKTLTTAVAEPALGKSVPTEKLHSITVNKKMGLIDSKGNVIVKPIFDTLYSAGDSKPIWIVRINNKCGYISNSRVLISPKFDQCGSFWEGLAAVKIGSYYNYVNESGNLLSPAKFQKAGSFSDGVAPVKDNNRFIYIDKSGKRAFDKDFEDAKSFSEGLAVAKLNGKYGYISKNGEFVIKPIYDNAYYFKNGRGQVVLNNKEYFIDNKGRILFEPTYDHIDNFVFDTKNLISVSVGKKHGLINMSGQWIVKPQYQDSIRFSEGLASVHLMSGGSAVIDESGQFVIPPTQLYIYGFNEGLAQAQTSINGTSKSGFIDTTGNFVIPPIYDEVGYFMDGIAPVLLKAKNLYLYIDKNGKEIWRGSAKEFYRYH